MKSFLLFCLTLTSLSIQAATDVPVYAQGQLLGVAQVNSELNPGFQGRMTVDFEGQTSTLICRLDPRLNPSIRYANIITCQGANEFPRARVVVTDQARHQAFELTFFEGTGSFVY